MTLKVKNWVRFQHFKDRKPIWIKLYRDVLDDIEWHKLSGDDAKMLVMLWLIASEHQGELPPTGELSFRLRIPEKLIKSSVSRLYHWLRQDDINAISDINQISTECQDGYQDDTDSVALARSQEKRREEKRREEGFTLPSFIEKSLWDSWVQGRKSKSITDNAAKLAIRQLTEWNDAGLDANDSLKKAVIGGHQGLYEPQKHAGKAATKKDWSEKPDWVTQAGFADVADANAARCWQSNASEFHDGKHQVAA